MAGGAELEQLSHELEGAGGAVADIGHEMEEDVDELGIGHEPGTDSGAGSSATSTGGASSTTAT